MFKKLAASTLLAVSAMGGVGVLTVTGAGTASAANRCTPIGRFVSVPVMYAGQQPAHQSASETRLNGPNCSRNELRASVAKVQRAVHVTADGVFGAGTRAAVIRFQRAHRLAADGVVGPATLRAMGLVYIAA